VRFLAQNAQENIWQPGSVHTGSGSLQRFARLPNYI